MTTYLLRRLAKDPAWQFAFAAVEEQAKLIYKDMLVADLEWADYVFPQDVQIPLIGINNKIMKQYIKNNMYNVTKTLFSEPIVDYVPDPAPWVGKYLKLSNVQTAMKETDSGNYLLGKIDTNIPDNFWDKL